MYFAHCSPTHSAKKAVTKLPKTHLQAYFITLRSCSSILFKLTRKYHVLLSLREISISPPNLLSLCFLSSTVVEVPLFWSIEHWHAKYRLNTHIVSENRKIKQNFYIYILEQYETGVVTYQMPQIDRNWLPNFQSNEACK